LNANVPRSHTDLVSDPLTLQYDRATLYRNLIDMTEAGLVARNDFGDHVWRFELTRGLIVNGKQVISLPIAAHPHFLCLACEQVRCLPQDSLQLKAEGGLVPEQVHQVLLRGHCEACYPKILANNPPISRQPTGTQAGA
jgi:Fur family ferric uptake transcriptional regulator